MAWVTAVAHVQSLAQELLCTLGMAKNKIKYTCLYAYRCINNMCLGHAQSTQKFLGKGLNRHHSSDPHHNSDNIVSLTRCATRELFYMIK